MDFKKFRRLDDMGIIEIVGILKWDRVRLTINLLSIKLLVFLFFLENESYSILVIESLELNIRF